MSKLISGLRQREKLSMLHKGCYLRDKTDSTLILKPIRNELMSKCIKNVSSTFCSNMIGFLNYVYD